MADLKLTLATGPYDRMRALGTGGVKVEGVEPTHVAIVEPPEIFTRMARDHRRRLGALRDMLPWRGEHLAEIDDLFDGDAWPYGLEPNRVLLETFVQYLAEQGYLPTPPTLDELFTPVVGQSQRGPRDRH